MNQTNSNFDFGDFVTIEQKRYGAENEHYKYKVIQPLRCNWYRAVPVDACAPTPSKGDVCDAIRVVCCGVCEDKIEIFRTQDVRAIKLTKQGLNH